MMRTLAIGWIASLVLVVPSVAWAQLPQLPASCPPGTVKVKKSYGEFCNPHPCVSEASCKEDGGECKQMSLCVVAGTADGKNFRAAVGLCGPDDSCEAPATCEKDYNVCVASAGEGAAGTQEAKPATAESAASGSDSTGGSESPSQEAGKSKDDKCSIGGSASLPMMLILAVAMLAAGRRRRA